MRALIVDDSKFLRNYLRNTLQQMGVTCEEANNGQEALAALGSMGPFDLMLLDANMPVMSGIECIKTRYNSQLSPKTKVMMVTTEAEYSYIQRTLDYGADEFLMKPFTPEALREKLSMLGFATAS
jgi:two-component system chemotaxis response regulator CheY